MLRELHESRYVQFHSDFIEEQSTYILGRLQGEIMHGDRQR